MTKQSNPPFSKAKSPKHRRLTLLLSVAALGLLVYTGTQVTPKRLAELKSATFPTTYTPPMTGQAGSYLAGRYAAANGDFASASRFLGNTLNYDPNNLDIAGYTYRTSLIYGDMEEALKMAQKLYAAGDEDSNPEIMIFLSLMKQEKYVEAGKVLSKFNNEGFNLVVVPLMEGWLNLAEGKMKEPLKQNENLRRLAEFSPFIYYHSALINDMGGFEDEAIVQYNEALSLSKVAPYRVVEMLVNLLERRGEIDKAKAVIARYREKNPEAMQFTLTEPQKGEKVPPRIIHTPREGLAEIFFSTASILQNENLNEEALIYVQQVLYLNPDFQAALLMRGTLLEEMKQLPEALTAYDKVLPDSLYYERAQLRKAYVLNAMDKSDEALVLLGKLERNVNDPYQSQLTRGDILMRLKRYDEAVKAYTAALDTIKTPGASQWPVFYARGISYERLDKWEPAEKDFRKALEIEPEQPDVLNYLGYSWLVRGEHLDEAKKMLERAVLARPADGHIVDSMGWALYLLGDYQGAVAFLERAIELMPVDTTVNDHLGDAYWQLGRRNEARFQWKRALLFNPDEEQTQNLNKKLADGLDAVQKKTSMSAEEVNQRQRVQLRE